MHRRVWSGITLTRNSITCIIMRALVYSSFALFDDCFVLICIDVALFQDAKSGRRGWVMPDHTPWETFPGHTPWVGSVPLSPGPTVCTSTQHTPRLQQYISSLQHSNTSEQPLQRNCEPNKQHTISIEESRSNDKSFLFLYFPVVKYVGSVCKSTITLNLLIKIQNKNTNTQLLQQINTTDSHFQPINCRSSSPNQVLLFADQNLERNSEGSRFLNLITSKQREIVKKRSTRTEIKVLRSREGRSIQVPVIYSKYLQSDNFRIINNSNSTLPVTLSFLAKLNIHFILQIIIAYLQILIYLHLSKKITWNIS